MYNILICDDEADIVSALKIYLASPDLRFFEASTGLGALEMLEKEKGIVVKTSIEEISARLAGDYMASKLGVTPSDAILVRKRMVLDENGVPVEYNIGYYRSDSFTYTIESVR